MLGSPISFELAQANMSRLDAVDWPQVANMIQELVERGHGLVQHAGVPEHDISVSISTMMRYVGQGYEVEVPIERRAIASADEGAVAERFSESYQKRFGRTEKMASEITTWRVVVSGPRPPLYDTIRNEGHSADASPLPRSTRPIWFGAAEEFVETQVFDRRTLGPGATIAGPAVVEEDESTLIVPPDFSGVVDDGLNIIVSRNT